MASATVAALTRDYFLWIAIFSLILAFALYVYFVPSAFEFFDTQKKDTRVRSEPPPINLPAPTLAQVQPQQPVQEPVEQQKPQQKPQQQQQQQPQPQPQEEPIDLTHELAPSFQ